MGRSKALLPLGGDTFVTHLSRVLLRAGASPVVVTVPEPPEDSVVTAALASVDVVVTRNTAPDDGLAGSLATAIALLPDDIDLLVFCPVDMPFVTTALVRKLTAAMEAGALAALPVVGEERGHPVVVSRALFEELRTCANDGGARAVLERHAGETATVAWGDARVLENINTPEDFERVMSRD